MKATYLCTKVSTLSADNSKVYFQNEDSNFTLVLKTEDCKFEAGSEYELELTEVAKVENQD